MSIGGSMLRRVAQSGLTLALLGTLAFGTAPVLAQEDEIDYSELSGVIEIDGSSTVGPVTEAVAEEFGLAGGTNVEISLGISGTGGGFQRFCSDETTISNASRAISDEERERCAENGVEFYEFLIGLDGITVVVNPENEFLSCISASALANMWIDGSTVSTWADVNPEFPAETINLYGPGPDSGTFDFFNEIILGDDPPRTDFTPSEDDNVLVEGVANDPYALGYFGYAYFVQNTDILTDVAIAESDDLSDCVEPTAETIADGSYLISRPLYVYLNNEHLEDEAVQAFLRFYFDNAEELVADVGYVALPSEDYTAVVEKLEGAISGEVVPDSDAGGGAMDDEEEATPEA